MCGTVRVQFGAQQRVVNRQHGHGKQGRIDGTGIANGKRGHRHAFGHLHHTVQRIDAIEVFAGHRHPQHRHRGFGRQHARQVCCTPRSGNDRFEAPASGLFGVGKHVVRHAVGRNHLRLMRNAEVLENLHRVLQGVPVRPGTHENGHFDAALMGTASDFIHVYNFRRLTMRRACALFCRPVLYLPTPQSHPEPSKMINVTVENFDAEVIEASAHTPVLVDFWAPWCGPCKVIGPLLEKIEAEYAGRFKLVKIDSDKEQELGQAFGIRSIPTCVLLMGGKPVDGFTGALPEGQIKAFLDKHVPQADVLEAEVTGVEVSDAPAADDPAALRDALHQAVLKTPDNDDARFDYVKLLLTEGDTDGAKVTFAPVIARTGLVRKFDALQRWINAIDFVSNNPIETSENADFDAKIAANRRDFDARFGKAQTLMALQQWTAAMDELLEILMRDKTWSEDLARKTFIAILDIIEPPKVKVADGQIPPADPTVATYRRRLSSVVLS